MWCYFPVLPITITPLPFTCIPFLTSDNELALVLYSGSLVTCNAGVVAIVHQCKVWDAQGTGKIDVVYGDTQAGRDWLTVLLPGDKDRLVAWHHHTRDEDSLANGKPRKLKWMNSRWDWRKDMQIRYLLWIFQNTCQKQPQLCHQALSHHRNFIYGGGSCCSAKGFSSVKCW